MIGSGASDAADGRVVQCDRAGPLPIHPGGPLLAARHRVGVPWGTEEDWPRHSGLDRILDYGIFNF